MRMRIESTTEVGEIITAEGARVPCRIWRGTTEGGSQCVLFVTRIAAVGDDSEFRAELFDASAHTRTMIV